MATPTRIATLAALISLATPDDSIYDRTMHQLYIIINIIIIYTIKYTTYEKVCIYTCWYNYTSRYVNRLNLRWIIICGSGTYNRQKRLPKMPPESKLHYKTTRFRTFPDSRPKPYHTVGGIKHPITL